MTSTAEILARLDLTPAETAPPLHIAVGPVGLTILCPARLREELADYFSDALTDTPGTLRVHILPGQTLTPDPVWTNWAREPGKTGRKDAIHDLTDGRLIRKVRSGVTFLQAPDIAVAFGPLTDHTSTVINFVNSQILSVCQRDGWQLCHAAAVTGHDRTLAISGLSGGGKSTSILRMMDMDGTAFVSNDRLLVREGPPAQALGIPKQPRINPGTILGNPRLHGMLTANRRAALAAMAPDDLWSLEEKYDLIVRDIYGLGRVQFAAPLTDFWVLNWQRDAAAPTQVSEVDLAARPDLLSAIMKSPGPFHQHADGRFEASGTLPDPAPYLVALKGVRVCEVSGRVDFDALAAEGRRLFHG